MLIKRLIHSKYLLLLVFVIMPVLFLACSAKKNREKIVNEGAPGSATDLSEKTPQPSQLQIGDSILYRCETFLYLNNTDTIIFSTADHGELLAIVTRSIVSEQGVYTHRAIFDAYAHGYIILSTAQCVTTGTVSIPELSISKRISTDKLKGVLRVGVPSRDDFIERDSVLIPERP